MIMWRMYISVSFSASLIHSTLSMFEREKSWDKYVTHDYLLSLFLLLSNLIPRYLCVYEEELEKLN